MAQKSRLLTKIKYSVFGLSSITLVVILLASYFMLLPPLKERSISNAQNINSQIIYQTDNLLQSVENFSNGITSSSDFVTSYMDYLSNPDDARLKEILRINLNQITSQLSVVRNIVIQTQGGLLINSITNYDDFDLSLVQSAWYKKLRSIDFSSGISNVYKCVENGQTHYVAAYCKDINVGGSPATLIVFFTVDNLISTTNSLSQKNFDYFVWMDSSRKSFYSSADGAWASMIEKKFAKSNYIPQTKYFTGYHGYNFMNTSSYSNWMLVSYISDYSFTKTFINYFLTICLLIIILFSLTLLLITPAIARITRPLDKLAAVMTEVSKGNLDITSPVETNDEIGDLSRIFNHMVADLRQYIKTLLEKEDQENRMKYSLLISQIDPHFIYNTMNTINYLAASNRSNDIIAVNTALIHILQDRLRVSDIQIFDTLDQEIMIVKQYVLIQRYRFDSNFNIQMEIGEELLSEQIPKNIIQPLVENAMLHGLMDEEDGRVHGTIILSATRNNGSLNIMVCDNGRGMDKDLVDRINQNVFPSDSGSRGRHIGLKNISERLNYLYGKRNCLHVESNSGRGTRVSVTIPDKDS